MQLEMQISALDLLMAEFDVNKLLFAFV